MSRFQLTGLCIFSAVLLSLPWLNILPGWILFVALIPLLIVEDHLTNHQDKYTGIVFFSYAYLCFWLWNSLTTWWIMNATLIGAILVGLLNAAFMTTVWWLFHMVKHRFRLLANLSLVIFWISFEYLHYNWEIQWPWLTLGNGFANQVKLVQWYQYTGVLGGSVWVLTINLLLFQLYKKITGNELRRLKESVVLILFAVLVPSWLSVRDYNRYRESGNPYEIIILQPNIDPYTEKFDGMSQSEQVGILIHLTDSLLTDSTDYVIGPETALPPVWEMQSMYNHPYLSPFYTRALAHPKLKFVLGATTRIRFHKGEEMPSTIRLNRVDSTWYDVYNTALQIDGSGKVQIYHKSILVTGVEKMPFSKYFSFLEKYIIDLGGTTGSLGSQKEPSNFISETGLQAAPVICYESIFGEYITDYIKKGAGLIFIMTNDGWWKDTPGYKQHLSFARLRAIETRRSIARSANTGISAFINQRGDILQQTDWWTRTAIDGTLRANDNLTFYVRYGDYLGRISSFMAVLLLIYYLSQKYMKK
jgi:apolipoprotein N-acyltransferase